MEELDLQAPPGRVNSGRKSADLRMVLSLEPAPEARLRTGDVQVSTLQQT